MGRRATAALGTALLLALHPGTAVAADPIPTVMGGGKPPASYAEAIWLDPEGERQIVYVYSTAQVLKIDARISYLEDKATKECLAGQIEAAKHTSVWWQVAAGLVAGAGIGFCAAHSGHCGIGK